MSEEKKDKRKGLMFIDEVNVIIGVRTEEDIQVILEELKDLVKEYQSEEDTLKFNGTDPNSIVNTQLDSQGKKSTNTPNEGYDGSSLRYLEYLLTSQEKREPSINSFGSSSPITIDLKNSSKLLLSKNIEIEIFGKKHTLWEESKEK